MMQNRMSFQFAWLPITCVVLAGSVNAQPPQLTSEQLISIRNSAAIQQPTTAEIRAALKPLTDEKISTQVPEGITPADVSIGVYEETRPAVPIFRGDDFSYTDFHWAASNLRHRPLYFEDAMLERHGQAYCPLIQPAASVHGSFSLSRCCPTS